MTYAEIPYAEIRERIRQADIVLTSGNRLHSRLIRWFTRSQWSHVGLLFWHTDVEPHRLMVYEAVKSGTRQIPLSEFVKDKKRIVALARHPKVHAWNAGFIQGMALDRMAVPYDTGHLFQIAWRIVKGKFGWKGTVPMNSKLLCSEYVATCLAAAEIDIVPDERGFVSPQTVAEQIQIIGRIV